MWKFWYSANQHKRSKESVEFFGVRFDRDHPDNYALINGELKLYTETVSDPNTDYEPNWDDKIYLGEGVYACNEYNLQTYLKKHPEVKFGETDWPDLLFEAWEL